MLRPRHYLALHVLSPSNAQLVIVLRGRYSVTAPCSVRKLPVVDEVDVDGRIDVYFGY